ncbi:MAG: U32 family peptidase [Clostridia bacterium]|nr:U32 family peptidase [Clostridia bacterium]
MVELLAPAGNMEKLKTAFKFGADACYMAGKKFGLRAFSGNFEENELKDAVDYAHSISKKIYVTVNIVAHNSDFDGLKEYLEFLNSISVDGIIVSDLGIISLARECVPSLDVHVSTQANVTNKYTAKFLCDLGVKRLVLARELSIAEIKEIREFIPKDVEIETFVHGAMCISYSGRCLLSNYLTGRDSNRGACVQACRFEYSICEKSRNSEHYDIQEDERGTYILNSKDLCMIKYINELVDAGVTSFKIEGRMKSPYYVATVTNAYRRAIDDYYKGKGFDESLSQELEKTSHRRYTTGFYFGEKDKEYLESSMPIQTHEFMAIVKEDSCNGRVLVEQRNRFKQGEELEVLSPGVEFNKKILIENMQNMNGDVVLDANKVQELLYIDTSLQLKEGDILRKLIQKK